MAEHFKRIICSKCKLEIWYSTINEHIDCTRCGFKIPVEPFIAEEEIELTSDTN